MKTIQLLVLLLGLLPQLSYAVPSPASVFCVDNMKGTEVQAADHSGIIFCKLGDKSLVAEDTLYLQTHGRSQKAIETLLNPPKVNRTEPCPGNPSSCYCEDVGGKSIGAGVGFGYCKFPDGSIIEEWTLRNGKTGNENLFKAVQGKEPITDSDGNTYDNCSYDYVPLRVTATQVCGPDSKSPDVCVGSMSCDVKIKSSGVTVNGAKSSVTCTATGPADPKTKVGPCPAADDCARDPASYGSAAQNYQYENASNGFATGGKVMEAK